MALFLYAHNIALAKMTGITKVGFQLFKSINLQKKKITILSHASKKSLQSEYNGIIYPGIKFQLLKYRTYLVKNSLKKAIMLFLNLFRYSFNPSKFSDNDVIIFNHIELNSQFIFFLKNCKAKKIIWLHATPNSYMAEADYLKRIKFIVEAYNYADLVVHLSNKSIESWKKYGLLSNSIVISNTIEPKLQTNEIKNIDVLIIGSITEQKGYGDILNNLELFVNIQFNINIIGGKGGKFASEFLSAIVDFDNIKYLGLVSDPENYIASAKIIWCLSQGEGQSLAMIESLEKGKPIISTDYFGADEIVNHGKNGYLFPNGSINSFINSTEDLLIDDNKYQKFSNYSSKLYNSKFSNKIFHNKFNNLINDVTTNS